MNQNLYNVVRFFVIINSAINPIAYALLKRDIKKELHKIFRQKPVTLKSKQEKPELFKVCFSSSLYLN